MGRAILGLLLAIGLCLAVVANEGEGAASIAFTDVTSLAGVDYNQNATSGLCGGGTALMCFLGALQSGGAAVGDVDGNGHDDLFVTRYDTSDLLFMNAGNGTFTEEASTRGLTPVSTTNGALFADIDNDGDLDLMVNTVSRNRFYVYVNDGTGQFAEEGAIRVPAMNDFRPHAGWSIAAGDYDGDGWVDLFSVEWGASEVIDPPTAHHALLLRNLGDAAPGYFEDTTAEAEVVLELGFVGEDPPLTVLGFAPAFADLDRDGHLDLAVAADFGTSQLFWNDGDGTFTDGTDAAMVGTDENGMGSTFGDYDGDGDLDWFVTSIFDDVNDCPAECSWETTGNRLYRNDGSRGFSDATDSAGVRNGYWGWGTAFFDYDNDRDLDLVMTNGIDFSSPARAGGGQPFDIWIDDPMRFWDNDGSGAMTEISASLGVTDTGTGAGLLRWDFDADGDLDVFVVNTKSGPVLYRNDGGNNNDWLRVRFTAASRNFEGLNAFITVTPEESGASQVREMGVSSHFLGQSERVAHFGLGAPSAMPVHEVKVEWPRTGTVQTFNDVARNQTFVITAPTAEVIDPDTAPPAVISMTPESAGYIETLPVVYDVSFSKYVEGLTPGAFEVAALFGLDSAEVTQLEGSGDTYRVTIGNTQGPATIRLDLTDVTGISDTLGVAMVATAQGDTTDILQGDEGEAEGPNEGEGGGEGSGDGEGTSEGEGAPEGEGEGSAEGEGPCTVVLNGSQVVPPSGSAATGVMTVVENGSVVNVTIVHDVVDAANVFIRQGGPGNEGPVVINVTSDAVSPVNKTLLASQFEAVRTGHYVEITSTTFPDGEIRGQISCGDVVEGEGEGVREGSPEGEGQSPDGEGEGETSCGDFDADCNFVVSLSELLRVIQFFNSDGFSCAVPPESTEDGYQPGPGDTSCAAHDSDYNPQDWGISLSELLRLIQFFNSAGYFDCPDADPPTEDGFCAGAAA